MVRFNVHTKPTAESQNDIQNISLNQDSQLKCIGSVTIISCLCEIQQKEYFSLQGMDATNTVVKCNGELHT